MNFRFPRIVLLSLALSVPCTAHAFPAYPGAGPGGRGSGPADILSLFSGFANRDFPSVGATTHAGRGLEGTWNIESLGINAFGQVTGYVASDDGSMHAFVYSNGSMQDLGALGASRGGSGSSAQDGDNAGQSAGRSAAFGRAAPHAFQHITARMTDLGTPAGPSTSDGPSTSGRGAATGNGGTLSGGWSEGSAVGSGGSGSGGGRSNTLGNTLQDAFRHINESMNGGSTADGSTLGGDGAILAVLTATGESGSGTGTRTRTGSTGSNGNGSGPVVPQSPLFRGAPQGAPDDSGDPTPTAATPEPGTMLLMGVGALGAAFMRRRARRP